MTEDGKVVKHGMDMIKSFTERGLVPVIHGDAVLDVKKTTNILSGDTITVVRRSSSHFQERPTFEIRNRIFTV